MKRVAAAALVALIGPLGPAAADEIVTYDVRGRADASRLDPRTGALDAAFAAAVREAVARLIGAPNGDTAAVVEREIVSRARRFVASFQVRDQGAAEGWLELAVAVRVDHDKLRARLGEVGLAAASTSPPARGSRAVVLMRVVGVGPAAANFGAGRQQVPGLDRVAEVLDRAGWVAIEPPVTAAPLDDLNARWPIDDRGARSAAAQARAQVAVVLEVRVAAPGPVRGTSLSAAPAEVALRVVDVATGAIVIDATARAGASGTDQDLPRRAAEAAVAAVAASWPIASAPPPSPLNSHSFEPRRGTAVRVRGSGAWNVAAALKAQLAGAPGVRQIAYAGIAADQVVLDVIGSNPAALAAAVRTSPNTRGRIATAGRTIDVGLDDSQ